MESGMAFSRLPAGSSPPQLETVVNDRDQVQNLTVFSAWAADMMIGFMKSQADQGETRLVLFNLAK
jgi:hypothetical protein